MTASVQRLGVFGGAFDPPHNAHVALVQAAQRQLALDEVRIVPTGQAWHKSRHLSAPEHRLAMAHLAFDRLPGCVLDTCELQRQGPSYTVDTLIAFRALLPEARIFLLLGADQGASLKTWHRIAEVVQLATVVVAPRAVDQPSVDHPDIPVSELDMAVHDVASTHIRARLAQGLNVDDLVPPGVARYIEQHSLYRNL